MQQNDREFRELDRWYRSRRPDLDVPDLKRLWNTAVSIQRKYYLCAEPRNEDDDQELCVEFMEAVKYSLARFDRNKQPPNPLMHEQDRIYDHVAEAIKWRLHKIRDATNQDEQRRNENKHLWDGPTGETYLTAFAPIDKTPVLVAVVETVDKLPPRDRDLIKMRYGTMATFAEIAEAFGFNNDDKARREVARAEERLRRILQHNDYCLPQDDAEDFLEKSCGNGSKTDYLL